MEFDNNKPIYLQIGSSICERILSKELLPEDRILSVRELGTELGVNPNTVARSYEKLTASGIIYNKRGIGYFVSPDAYRLVLENERENFLEYEAPLFLKRMHLLGINIEDLLRIDTN